MFFENSASIFSRIIDVWIPLTKSNLVDLPLSYISLFNKEIEVNKNIILICYHLVDFLGYICLVSGVILFFAIPVAGLLVVALSKLLFDISAQYKMVLKIMNNFKTKN